MSKSSLTNRFLARLLAVALFWTLCVDNNANAQTSRRGTIDAGTTIKVRTVETIDAEDNDGRMFSGVVDQNVVNRAGNIAIPKGSDVELVVREISSTEVALDLDAVIVNGQRYGVVTDSSLIESERKSGVGVNKRTGKYVGGGAVVGAVIGAIAGGKKGAAIGAGAGAAAGAGAQILTRGGKVSVPVESLLTFRLQQPLQLGATNTLTSDQYRYKSLEVDQASAAYRAGLRAGRSDAERELPMNMQNTRRGQQRLDYEAGYEEGYESVERIDRAAVRGTISVGRDNNVTWRAPVEARVFVQVDNHRPQLFAEAQSGTQLAPWLERGHVYVFILRDMSDNEIARTRLDLR